jgi:phosphoribosylanthranilate isomerase
MTVMARPRIKICCIMSVAEARLAVSAGASALGLVGAMPSGPGVIDDALIAEIAAVVPPPIATFLLTSETRADAIVDHVRRCGTNTVQLVDRVEEGGHAAIRRALPLVKIVQVLHVADADVVDEAQALAGAVDAFLLDSGNPNLAVKNPAAPAAA